MAGTFARAQISGGVVEWPAGYFPANSMLVPMEAQSKVTAIAVGAGHILALKLGGSVLAWGESGSNQTLVPIEAQAGVTAVAAGYAHSVALKNGGVIAWGYGGRGQTTVPLEAQSGVVAISAGYSHTLALKGSGSVLAWGETGPIPAEALIGVKAIAAGAFHNVGLKSDGTVFVWGYLTNVPPGLRGVAAIAAGWDYSLALTSNGTVVAWGSQTNVPAAARSGVKAIAAGNGQNVALKSDDSIVAWSDDIILPAQVETALAVAAGGPRIVVVAPVRAPTLLTQPTNLTVYAGDLARFSASGSGLPTPAFQWQLNGTNLPGYTNSVLELPNVAAAQAGAYSVILTNEVGARTSVVATLTVQVIAPTIWMGPSSQVVAQGQTASFTVRANGSRLLYQWRKNGADIPGATGATCALGLARPVLAGNYSVVVRNEADVVVSTPAQLTVIPPLVGDVFAWGDSKYGQSPIPLSAQTGAVSVAAGIFHTLILKADSSILALGSNMFGEILIPSQAQSGISAIAAGGYHNLALKTNGAVVGWGANFYGQSDVPAVAQTGVVAIAAGQNLSVALKEDGSVWQWGYGGLQLLAGPQSGVVAIAAGTLHSLAVKNDGSVLGWGWNGDFQARVLTEASNSVIAVAAGDYHSLALRSDGSVVGSGSGSDGQITIPEGALSVVTAIAAGFAHSLALKEAGSLLAWGASDPWDNHGQVPEPRNFSGGIGIAAGAYHNVVLYIPRLPVITTEPKNITINAGQDATIFVAATNFPYQSQWLFNGQPISGSNQNSLVLRGVSGSQAGAYQVVLTNRAGTVTSAVATLTVNIFPPVIVYPPLDQNLFAGATLILEAGAIGAPPPSFRWQFNGRDIPGANDSYIRMDNMSTNNTGAYQIIASNQAGSVTSAVAMVTVEIPDPFDFWAYRGMEPSAWVELYGVAFGQNKFVAVGDQGVILVSSDGMSWSNRAPASSTNRLHGIAWGTSNCVAVGVKGAMFTSLDGLSWSKLGPYTSNYLKSICYGIDRFVAVGASGTLLVCSNGSLWTQKFTGTDETLNAVTFGKGIFVAVGDNGVTNSVIFISTNGVFWTRCESTTRKNLRGVAYGRDRFMAVGNDGTILTSSDARVWIQSIPTNIDWTTENLRGVTYGGGNFVVVGNEGNLWTSPDALSWTPRSDLDDNLTSVAYGQGRFVVVGDYGSISQSGVMLSLSGHASAEGSAYELNILGERSRGYRIQASSDLRNWTDVFTYTNPEPVTLFADPGLKNNPARFYRVLSK
jgi:alpha-tubulin suppressor-like RCC1 family protein